MKLWPGYIRAVPLGCGLALAVAGNVSESIAQEPAVEPSSAVDQAEYSKGFALLSQLGCPDSAKAAYGTLRNGSFRFGVSSERESWESMASNFHLKGNAWLFPESGGKQQVLIENVQLAPFIPPSKGQSPEGREIPNPSADQFTALTIKDLGEDAKLVLQGLKSKENIRAGYYGEFLLFSAHLASHGLAKEANQIAARLFELAEDPAIVLSEAINSLADAKYEESLDRLFASKGASSDWQSFEKELQNLLAQFGPDWKLATVVRRVGQEAKKRSPKPPAPPGLNSDDRKLADALAEAVWSGNHGYSYEIWTIKGDPTGVPALDQIRARGIRAFPLLISLLKDDYPTRTDYRTLRSAGFSGDDFGGQDDSPEQAQKRAYGRIRRPSTRGEIAAHLLNQALPLGSEENGVPRSLPPEQLPEEAAKFYKENQDKSASQLALIYLKKGNRFQTQFASMHALKEKSPEDLAAIEAYLLEDSLGHFNPMILREVAKARGRAGAAFLEKYRQAIESGKGANPDRYYPGMEKQVLQEIKAIQEGLSGKTAAQIAEEVKSGKRQWKDAMRSFQEAISREAPEKAIDLILDLAIGEKEPVAKMEDLGMIWAVRRSGDPTRAGSPAPLDPKKHAEKWRKLLGDPSRLEANLSNETGIETVGSSTALLIDILYGKVNPMDLLMNQTFSSLGSRVDGVLHARAEARLTGKAEADIPKIPSANDVSSERKQALATKLASAKPGELAEILASLNDSDILALAEETSFKANLLPIAHQVKSIKLEGFEAASAKKPEKWKGKPLDNELIATLSALATEAVKSGKVVSGTIMRAPLGQGVSIELLAREKPKDQRSLVPPGTIACYLLCGKTRAQKMSMVRNSDPDSSDSDFSAKVKSFLEGDLGVIAQAEIKIMGAPEGSTDQNTETDVEITE